jgi:hypothetical protein
VALLHLLLIGLLHLEWAVHLRADAPVLLTNVDWTLLVDLALTQRVLVSFSIDVIPALMWALLRVKDYRLTSLGEESFWLDW